MQRNVTGVASYMRKNIMCLHQNLEKAGGDIASEKTIIHMKKQRLIYVRAVKELWLIG